MFLLYSQWNEMCPVLLRINHLYNCLWYIKEFIKNISKYLFYIVYIFVCSSSLRFQNIYLKTILGDMHLQVSVDPLFGSGIPWTYQNTVKSKFLNKELSLKGWRNCASQIIFFIQASPLRPNLKLDECFWLSL